MGLNTTDCPGTIATNGSITLCLSAFSAQQSFWEAYGDTMVAALATLPPRHGAFFTCVACARRRGRDVEKL